ncbi:MAG: Na/Pi cotransporter family protein [Candidatus Izemoplasma sp.]
MIADVVDINWQETLFLIFGGLGIFLYGINLMGDSLKALAGNKLKIIIEKTTNTPLKGIFVGIIITGLIQSSSGTTALTVGLVRAGLMTLPQAIGVILGANIGTTVTSLLLGLPIKEYALPIMAAGSFFIFFVSKKKVKQFGSVMLGFGMLFYGLDLMGDALKALSNLPEFRDALLAVSDYPVLGVLVGAGTTATIQSSSATIGILQELYTTGYIPLKGAIAIVFGDNIGTTVTAILAAIGGSVAARRTAAAHVLFNVIGSLVFLIFLVPYTSFIQFLEDTLIDTSNPNNLKMTISFAHMGFNVMNTFIMFWFIKQLVWAVTKIIPGDDVIKPVDVDGLQDDLIKSSPILALESAKLVVANMGLLTKQMFEGAISYSFKQDNREFENGMQIEEMLDTIDHKAHDYLVKIARSGLDNESAQSQAEYIDAIRDFERIGDHCTNIFEFFELRYDSKSVLSEEAAGDLGKLYEVVLDSLTKTIEAFRTDDKDLALFIMEQEETIDRLVVKYRKRHIRRVNESDTSSNCSVYVDILSNIERIGDHCNNIAKNVVQDQYFSEDYMLAE